MPTLDELERSDPLYSLDEIVSITNELLPDYLPAGEQRASPRRVREEVNARLVRHYAGIGLIDDPAREGREARYGMRHLLQLLLVRRLLAEGYPSAVVRKMIMSKTDAELRSLLRGGAALTATTANPALDFLSEVRQRARLEKRPVASVAMPAMGNGRQPVAVPPVALAKAAPAWTRLEILPGLELHVRGDFQLPATPHERENLLQLLLDSLKNQPANRQRKDRPATP